MFSWLLWWLSDFPSMNSCLSSFHLLFLLFLIYISVIIQIFNQLLFFFHLNHFSFFALIYAAWFILDYSMLWIIILKSHLKTFITWWSYRQTHLEKIWGIYLRPKQFHEFKVLRLFFGLFCQIYPPILL
jgi:hypothetical protein